MAVAALVVATLALLIAGAALMYARIQANATTELARLDMERRRDERAPNWSLVFARDRGRSNLTLTNNGPGVALGASLELITYAGHPTVVSDLGDPAAPEALRDIGVVAIGTSRDIPIVENTNGSGGELRLLVESTDAQGHRFKQLVRCHVYGYASTSSSVARRSLGWRER